MRRLALYLYQHSSYGLAFLRIVIGLLFFYTGYRKVFVLDFAIDMFALRGLPIPQVLGPVFSILELGGGALLIIGLFARYIGILFTFEYLFHAIFLIFTHSFVSARLELMFLTAAIMIATQGVGRLAIDRQGRPWEPQLDRRKT